ncbi:unnamed protein product, partial [Owenia fusiformis]
SKLKPWVDPWINSSSSSSIDSCDVEIQNILSGPLFENTCIADSDDSPTNNLGLPDIQKHLKSPPVQQVCDVTHPGIYVRKVRHTSNTSHGIKKKNSLVYDAKHCCFFCKKVVTNISSHLRGKHGCEEEIMDIKNCTNKNIVRAKLDIIRNKGDHFHNVKTCRAKEGELLVRLSAGDLDIEKYGPCPMCLQWVVFGSTMYRHQKICPSKTLENLDSSPKSNTQQASTQDSDNSLTANIALT